MTAETDNCLSCGCGTSWMQGSENGDSWETHFNIAIQATWWPQCFKLLCFFCQKNYGQSSWGLKFKVFKLYYKQWLIDSLTIKTMGARALGTTPLWCLLLWLLMEQLKEFGLACWINSLFSLQVSSRVRQFFDMLSWIVRVSSDTVCFSTFCEHEREYVLCRLATALQPHLHPTTRRRCRQFSQPTHLSCEMSNTVTCCFSFTASKSYGDIFYELYIILIYSYSVVSFYVDDSNVDRSLTPHVVLLYYSVCICESLLFVAPVRCQCAIGKLDIQTNATTCLAPLERLWHARNSMNMCTYLAIHSSNWICLIAGTQQTIAQSTHGVALTPLLPCPLKKQPIILYSPSNHSSAHGLLSMTTLWTAHQLGPNLRFCLCNSLQYGCTRYDMLVHIWQIIDSTARVVYSEILGFNLSCSANHYYKYESIDRPICWSILVGISVSHKSLTVSRK